MTTTSDIPPALRERLLGARVDAPDGDSGCIVGFPESPVGECDVLVAWDSGVRTPAVLADLSCEVADRLADEVRRWRNCREATVAGDGRVWVADPQRGHWLSEGDLGDFVAWMASAER